MADTLLIAPTIERHRHELRRRSLTISAISRITPNMLRLTLAGPELDGFVSMSPGDHIKIFVPDGAGGTAMRDYTPRRYDAANGTLDIDFALHDAGPATLWAMQAKVGDVAQIGGPRGSQVISGPIQQWVLIGDETALPSIARRIEELPAGMPVISLVAVPGATDEQQIATAAAHRALWVHRDDPTDATGLLAQLDRIALTESSFVWIAAEAGVARAVRDAALARGHAPAWMKAAGYWVAGEADASDKDL
ncbi:siderophore-interacting protein [Gemmobacter aquaticus]|uniref:Siderophore-interacting protein n=1 Tax=Gemmobacter aquaticus TaxID=490185 RepID=A0A918DCD9_9RHOB|nr:siderophore-interacting protein [Gemmobacter aquaticus]GGO27370.1 siderophore-interacting protein [Gemmobacter aquaticus]